ncbi:MAG: hypothetical protein QM708_15445 [Propioniciclava sp.]|uniref:hypothetical protein n=1 Tax=Propioniciclava sp. TaxID=2038686 RepID=UPI0039E6D7E1
MAVIKVAYTALAAGNFVLQLVGGAGLPAFVGTGVQLWDRLAALTKPGRHQATLQRAIEGRLAHREYAAADQGDVSSADQAVARVLQTAPAGEQRRAAIRNQDHLHALLADIASRERALLQNEPAQAVFDVILNATVAHLVTMAAESDDFAKLAASVQLDDLANLAEQVRNVQARLEQIPAETVQLLAGPVLALNRPVTPTGRAIEPSRLLRPSSGRSRSWIVAACLRTSWRGPTLRTPSISESSVEAAAAARAGSRSSCAASCWIRRTGTHTLAS